MQDLQTKQITLNHENLHFLAMTIRRADDIIKRTNETHETLVRKIKLALRVIRYGHYEITFSLDSEELKLARQYNSDYCFILADKFGISEMMDAEVLEIYRLATKVQLLINSRY